MNTKNAQLAKSREQKTNASMSGRSRHECMLTEIIRRMEKVTIRLTKMY